MESSDEKDMPVKKSLEEMPHEDLVKKYKNVLAIAHKTKQSRDETVKQNDKLQRELTASKEMIDALMEQKIDLTQKVDSLKKLQTKYPEIETENESLKRQIKRLTDENEDLLQQLDTFENQANTASVTVKPEPEVSELQEMLSKSLEKITDLQEELSAKETLNIDLNKKIENLDHIKQELTKNLTSKNSIISDLEAELKEAKQNYKDVKDNENQLQKQLIVLSETLNEKQSLILNLESQIKTESSSNEIATLTNLLEQAKAENQNKIDQIENLTISNSESKKTIDDLTNLKIQLKNEVSALTSSLKIKEDNEIQMQNQLKDLTKRLEALNLKTDTHNEHSEEIQSLNEKYKSKLQNYRTKLIKLANVVKELKSSKSSLLDTVKEYNSNVERWQNEIRNVLQMINVNQQENTQKTEQLNGELVKLKQEISELKITKENLQVDAEKTNALYEEKIKLLENKNEGLEKKSCDSNVETEEFDKLKDEYSKSLLEKNNLLTELSILQEKFNDNLKVNEKLEVQVKNFDKERNHLNSLIGELEIKISNLETNFSKQAENEENTSSKLNKLQSALKSMESKANNLQEELNAAKNEKNENNESLSKQVEKIKNENNKLLHEIQTQKSLNEKQIIELQEKNSENCEIINELNQKLEQQSFIEKELRDLREKLNESVAGKKSQIDEIKSQKIIIEELKKINAKSNEKIALLEKEKSELAKQIDLAKKEKVELIDELKSMQVELKKRGVIISNEQETNKNLNIQLIEKNELVQSLQIEINNLEEKINNLENQNDSLSVSTISKADETNRLLELEGTWEERYNKLKELAIRLKKRSNNLQEQLQSAENEIIALKQQNETPTEVVVASKEESDSNKQSKDLTVLEKEKQSLNNLIKELKNTINSLEQEREVEKNAKKEFEARIKKIENELKIKEKQLSDEINKHKATKEQLTKVNKEVKKRSVLSLEMEDYERSLKEVSEKLEAKNIHIKSLESTIDTHSSTIGALRDQIRTLDDSIKLEESQNVQLKQQLDEAREKIQQLERVNLESYSTITRLENALETERSALEESNLQLAKVGGEHQKHTEAFKQEKDVLKATIFKLEEKIRTLIEQYQSSEKEVLRLKDEFDGYKVRATSVLRQNKNNGTPDHSIQRLSESNADLKAEIEILKTKLENANSVIQGFNEEITVLRESKAEWEKQSQELVSVLETLRKEHDELLESHTKQVAENNEALRAQKLRNDTLAQCYKQQLAEKEEAYKKEIDTLKGQLNVGKADNNSNSNPHKKFSGNNLRFYDDKLDISFMEREEGEGSESIESNSSLLNRPIPLDQLLNSSSDNINENRRKAESPTTQLRNTKQQLVQHEARVSHLTSLLSDSEKDLAKLTQLNQILKEEIRRHQRSVEREQHAENLEYMKNVVFKFITSNNGDEKTHLVPVLNTILKLSPEETQKLNSVARGIDVSGARGWSNYLPLPKWPGA